jgi:hypothetical protein
MFNFSLALLHSRPIHGPQSQWGFGYWAPAFFWILKFQLGRPFPPNPTKLCGCLVGLSRTPIWNSLGSLTLTTPSLRLSLSLSLSPIVIVGASRSSSYVQNYLCNMWQIAHTIVLLHLHLRIFLGQFLSFFEVIFCGGRFGKMVFFS